MLSSRQDDFYKRHMYSNFGDLGSAVQVHIVSVWCAAVAATVICKHTARTHAPRIQPLVQLQAGSRHAASWTGLQMRQADPSFT